MPASVFATALARMDVEKALLVASKSNDMLPPRREDGVGGAVGKRFSEHLKREIAEGRYVPTRVTTVAVPKPGFTTRPAAIMRLHDRVVYELLVSALADRVGEMLAPADSLFWPRGDPKADRRWSEFMAKPLADDASHIVVADIAGFYESIDHSELVGTLIHITGKSEVAVALQEFLRIVMGVGRGLPQGLDPSDLLSTAHLSPVDAIMIREGFKYFRNGDDIRIGCTDWNEARRAIALLEEAVRTRQLLLNGAKSLIKKRTTYESELQVVESAREEARSRAIQAREEILAKDRDALQETLDAHDLGETAWDVFYHGRMSVAEAIERLRDVLKPADVEVAVALIDETMKRAPGKWRGLGSSEFHARLVEALRVLEAGRSAHAVKYCEELLDAYPDKTGLVARYMLEIGKTRATEVAAVAAGVLGRSAYRTPVQLAWLFRVAALDPATASSDVVARMVRTVDNSASPLTRVEAALFLARHGSLRKEMASRLWSDLPEVFRADILAAVYNSDEDWADGFIQGARQDPIQRVVLARLRSEPE